MCGSHHPHAHIHVHVQQCSPSSGSGSSLQFQRSAFLAARFQLLGSRGFRATVQCAVRYVLMR